MHGSTLKVIAVLAVCGVCVSADAASRLIWQASLDGGETWQTGPNVQAYSTGTIKFRAIVDWTGTTAYGLSGLSQQVFISNHDTGDGGAIVASNGVGNRLGPFNFGAAILAARVTGTTQRIVALGIGGATEGNIISGQQAPASAGTLYSTANPAAIFAFDYAVGSLANRTLEVSSTIGTSSGVQSSFSYHASSISTSTSFRETGTVEPVRVTIVPNPGCRILEEPEDRTLVPGASASFSFGFSDPSATYQWRKDGVPLVDDSRISGSQTPTLVIRDLNSSDKGQYVCVLNTLCGGTRSRTAELTCKAIPIEQPRGGTFAASTLVVLSGQSAQTEGVTYRWRKDGSPLFNSSIFSGTTSPTLMIATTDPTQSGVYTVTATNNCGPTTSAPATVTIFCAADFNNDQWIDFSDFDAFVQAFKAGEARADINADGFLEFDDFDAFVFAFERGC